MAETPLVKKAVARAREIVHAVEWRGDMRVNMTTILGAGRVLDKRLTEVEAQRDRFRGIVEKLADNLASYEMDEPHWDDDDAAYPEVDLTEWLGQEHKGDCTGDSQPCLRCFADHVSHKAAWLIRASEAAAKETKGDTTTD